MQNLLHHLQLLVGNSSIRFRDQVGNVRTASTQVNDVDRGTSRDFLGVHQDLTVSHIAASSGGTLSLNISLNAASLHLKGSLATVGNVLGIRNQSKEVQRLLLQIFNGKRNDLSDLVAVLRSQILSQLMNDLIRLFDLIGVDTLIAILRGQHLDQLHAAFNLNISHVLSPPISQWCRQPSHRRQCQQWGFRSPCQSQTLRPQPADERAARRQPWWYKPACHKPESH